LKVTLVILCIVAALIPLAVAAFLWLAPLLGR
jgi:hypothetical protein